MKLPKKKKTLDYMVCFQSGKCTYLISTIK